MSDNNLKIMIVSNLHPLAIKELEGDLIDEIETNLFGRYPCVISAQEIALTLNGKIDYVDGFYSAVKTVSKHFLKEEKNDKLLSNTNIICYGTLDSKTFSSFDLVVGLKNNFYEEYVDFPKNENGMSLLDYKDCIKVYDTYEDLRSFLKVFIEFKNKENKTKNDNNKQRIDVFTKNKI